MSTRLRADLALVVISFVWGATFVVVKRALEDVSTVLFLTIRFIIAAAFLALFFRRGWMPERRHLFPGIVIGACLSVGYVLQTIGLETTTPANAGFITGFYIPLVPIAGALIQRRLPVWQEAGGVMLATLGIILLTLPTGNFSVRSGDLFVLAATFLFAAHILIVGHFSNIVPHKVLSFTQIAVGALMGLGSFWWIETPRIQWTWAVIGGLIVTAVFATAVALAVQTWAQQHTTPTRTALIFALEPVFAWMTSYVVSGELLTLRAGLGAVAVLAGIVLVEVRAAEKA